MRRIWVVVAALAWVALTTDARADTVYLTDGQNVWGKEVYEEGDDVVIVRPGGDLRIPKSQVNRIERVQSTLPPFYSPPAATPPAGEPPTRGVTPGMPGTPGTPPPPGTAAAPGAPALPGAPVGAVPPPTTGGMPPSGGVSTQLPSPTAPPAPSR